MTKLFEKRFAELAGQIDDVIAKKQTGYDQLYSKNYDYVDSELFLSWCVKASNLIFNSCGENSQHFKSFEKESKSNSNFLRARAVLSAAKEDYEGGYIASIKNLVQAEVFDSELEQATELLTAG